MIARVTSISATPTRRWRALIICALFALLSFGGTAADAATFTRGFVDDVWFDTPAGAAVTNQWLARTTATGAKLVQIEVDWTGIEPNAPQAGANLTSPSAAQFSFSELDQRVEEITSSGLVPVFLVTDAPRWAQANGGTATEYSQGGYKPNAKAFGNLGQALAKRYSGSFADPLRPGTKLPRVRYMQAWAEANTDFHLAPQWTRVGGRAVNTGPIIYRQMLNAFYAGVKAGDPKALVLTSGFEGYGDAPFTGLQRTHPVTFMDNLLCLSPSLKRTNCAGGPARFDVLAADPYDSFSPATHAVSPLDASAPDLGRLRKVVQAGLAAGTVLPHKAKPLWVTEFGYDSKPPNPSAVSTATQAKWLQEGFYTFWHEGASVAMWYLVRDQVPPYDVNYFSGVYFRNGRKKPAFTAYRFPFVVMNTSNGAAQVWGIAPVGGTVKVQFKTGAGWKTIRRLSAGANAVFDFTSSHLAAGHYRATVAGQSSLVWSH
jgi:hypothetical protein